MKKEPKYFAFSLCFQLKLLMTLLFLFSFSACRTKPVQEEQKAVEDIKPVEAKAPVLKRYVVDEDLHQNQDDKALRKRIVVLPFLDRNPERPEEILTRAREEFMNQLNKSQDLIAIDSEALKLELDKYIKNGDYDLNAIAQASQNSGASSLLEAKVIDVRFKNRPITEVIPTSKKASFEIVVKARVVNIRSGQELMNTVKTVTIEEENTPLPDNVTSDIFFGKNPELIELLIRDAFVDFTPKLVEALSQVIWEGRIAALQGERIYLNVGKISGVQIGDILKVVEDGNEIYDPEVGYHIGKIPGKVKGTLEVVGFFGQDGAVSVIHSGAGFKENDRIELYE